MKAHYYLIDAFAREVFQGAQVAVCLDADVLNQKQMQAIARELNQNECVFVQSSAEADNRFSLKVYSATGEISSNGHPLIATAYLLAKLSRISSGLSEFEHGKDITQVCIESSDKVVEKVRFCSKTEMHFDDFVPAAPELSDILHLDEKEIGLEDHPVLIVGSDEKFLLVPVKTEAALTSARFNINKWTMSFVASLASRILLYTGNHSVTGVDYHGRMLGKGIAEVDDPAVAPAVPALAASLFNSHGIERFVIQRGLGQLRQSLIEVEVESEASAIRQINVGGYAVISAEGDIYL
ncbi:MAG: PhzF family phenazine biosynthesis isomerase [Gammaproteobacteria bacterium]|nr:PhzF family phenazine biosynthesis isomerase [Gammaproteobacteria bacterium]